MTFLSAYINNARKRPFLLLVTSLTPLAFNVGYEGTQTIIQCSNVAIFVLKCSLDVLWSKLNPPTPRSPTFFYLNQTCMTVFLYSTLANFFFPLSPPRFYSLRLDPFYDRFDCCTRSFGNKNSRLHYPHETKQKFVLVCPFSRPHPLLTTDIYNTQRQSASTHGGRAERAPVMRWQSGIFSPLPTGLHCAAFLAYTTNYCSLQR